MLGMLGGMLLNGAFTAMRDEPTPATQACECSRFGPERPCCERCGCCEVRE